MGKLSGTSAILVAAALALAETLGAQDRPPAPWDSIAGTLGSPAVLGGGVYRFNFPRTDLTVRIGNLVVAPALALGSWAGFAVLGQDTVVMGDLVLTATELPPVQVAFAGSSLHVTAVHNHLSGEEPRVVYLHYMGSGSPIALAADLRRILAQTATPVPVRPATTQPVTIDTATIFGALGVHGKANGAIAQAGILLFPAPVGMGGGNIPPALGLISPLNFQAVSAGRVVATGDFAVTGDRVDPLIRALARNGITATAAHSHMIGETPSVYFIHFWADGAPAAVARGLHEALDAAR